ncbi:MAG: cytochrome b/b6 domain-containing protein [Alphaproteobacteria bacterium]
MQSFRVWDLPTRVFHWALVAAILLAYLTSSGHPQGFLFALHLAGGYSVVLLLVFRFAWGFAGGEHARFAGFVRGWRAVRNHAQSLWHLSPERSIGHNAIGGWMIVLLLLTLLLIVLTGLLSQGVTGGAGPLSSILPASLVKSVGAAHKWLGSAILYLAGVHVAGVLFESLLGRENLARAMVTGRKPARLAEMRDARAVPVRRALALALLAALLGAAMVSVTRMPPPSLAPAPQRATSD